MFNPRTPYAYSSTYTALRRSFQNRGQFNNQTRQNRAAQQKIAQLRQKSAESTNKAFLRKTERTLNPQLAESLSQLEQVKDPNVIPYNLRLRKLAKDRNWREALNCIREIHESGLRPDEISYATAIDACSKALKSKQAIQLFQEMKNEGITPNVPIYNAVMNACAKDHQWRKSLNFLQDMQKHGVDPNIVSYNVCLSALEKSKKWNLAFDMMKQMRSKNLPLQAITYNTVISACAKSRKMGVCEEVLKMMHQDGFKPDAFTYSSLLNGYRKTRNWNSLFRAFDDMRAHGIALDGVIYSTVIGAYADAGRTQDAFILFDAMKRQGIKANQIIYSCILRACSTAEQVDGLLREMEVNGVKKNSVVYTSAINVSHKVGGVENAVRWFNQMLGQGIKPDWVAYMSLFEVLNNEKRFDLLDLYYRDGLASGVLSHFAKDTNLNEKAIDLHGWSTALARAALRNVMQDYCSTHNPQHKLPSLRILTGKGYSKNQPVLRPAVTKMLMSDFEPRLQHETTQTGDIYIPVESIRSYIIHQKKVMTRKAEDLATNFKRQSLEEERRLDAKKAEEKRMNKLALEMESYTTNIANLDVDIANLERALVFRSNSPPPTYNLPENLKLANTPPGFSGRQNYYTSFMSSDLFIEPPVRARVTSNY